MFGAYWTGFKFGMMVLGALTPFIVIFLIIIGFIKNPAKVK